MSKKLDELKKNLQSGCVYRRKDLMVWSKAVDRHLKLLLEDGTLKKLSGGLYLCPKQTVFGAAPAEEEKLITAFLKDDRFLMVSPNSYNTLGLGTTQLYNEIVVYNHKRHGRFNLGGRVFDFKMKPYFPNKLSKEFLIVDLFNNLDNLAEDKSDILDKFKAKVDLFNQETLLDNVKEYGNLQCNKFFMKQKTITH